MARSCPVATSSTDLRSAAPRTGPFFVASAAVCWALIGIFANELNALGFTPVNIAAWRAGGAGLMFVAASRWRAVLQGDTPVSVGPTSRATCLRLGVFGVVGVVVFFVALPAAIRSGGVTLAYVLLYTAPAWVTVGHLAMGHPVQRLGIVLAGVAVLGVAMVVWGAGSAMAVSWRSVALGLLSGVSYASYYLLGKRLFGEFGLQRTYAWVLPLGALALFVIGGVKVPHGIGWVWVVALASVSTFVPYLLFAMGLARMGAPQASVIACVEPVVAAAIGVMMYGERLGFRSVVGAIMVIVSAVAAAMLSQPTHTGARI